MPFEITMKYFKIILLILGLFSVTLMLPSCKNVKQPGNQFIHVDKQNLIAPDGKPFLIKGINLGNWLNPEGYMFLFGNVNSFRLIDQALKEMVGPQFVNQFWKKFQDRYITRADIHFIHEAGMNTVRIPFHYKLFTDEDYMGSNNPQRGFQLLDRVISWFHDEGIYVILDIHDAPGGQTGANIDDSYGYPWLMVNEKDQKMYCNIWQKIARYYANNPTTMGYDLLNEPIVPYFHNLLMLNKQLEPLYKRVVTAIRKVDKNHVVILGGAQWDGNFKVFNDLNFDSNMMYSCHRYWCDTVQKVIQYLLDFRTKADLPLYMGETDENTDVWIFWPYKKMVKSSCMVSIKDPKYWNKIVEFTHQDNSSFAKVRKNRSSQDTVRMAMNELLQNLKFSNCKINKSYIEALGMKP